MKIGMDAVLLGAWADVAGKQILDVGTGCGIIALMCAQRNLSAEILAIDIDPASVEEAALNFESSPWKERLKASLEDFNDISLKNIDLIICNPPFFDAGITNFDSPRILARHCAGLSPLRLLEKGARLLSKEGRIAMVIPSSIKRDVIDKALSLNLYLLRICHVKGHSEAPAKRVLLEFGNYTVGNRLISETLTLRDSNGNPTPAHRDLCRSFYLKF